MDTSGYINLTITLTLKEKIEICLSDFKFFFKYSLWNKKHRYIGNTLTQEFLDCFDSFKDTSGYIRL
jgi:hypothetical protein